MIHPSYTELIEAINTNSEDDDTTMSLNSRYSLVLAASKRARQIIAGSKPMVEGAEGKKPLSVAIDELYKVRTDGNTIDKQKDVSENYRGIFSGTFL